MAKTLRYRTLYRPEVIEQILESESGDLARALLQTGARVEARAKRLASGQGSLSNGEKMSPNTGRLAASITHALGKRDGDMAVWIGSPVEYAENVHEGRQAGKPMPPDRPIRVWAKQRNIDTDLVFVIRRAISVRGIPPKPFLTDALEAENGVI